MSTIIDSDVSIGTSSDFSTSTYKSYLNMKSINSNHLMVSCGRAADDATAASILNLYSNTENVVLFPTPASNNTMYFYWKYKATKYRKIENAWLQLFTGQHKTLPDDPNIKINLNEHVGLIMSSNDTGYTSCDNSNNTYSGKRAIYINETLPNCSLSVIDEDPCVFGVISNNPNGSNGSGDDDSTTNFFTGLNDSVRVNSLGEGALWISNINGPIKNGDWITTSQIPGVGKKQSEIRRCNYTVAKATMSCDFEIGSNKYKTKPIEFKGQTYIMAFIGVTYHCG